MSLKPHANRGAAMKPFRDDLLRWTCERRATDCPLDRRLLRDKALELAGEHGLTGFNCSERWLTCFLKKHGFSLNLKDSCGPTFNNYQLWIDIMRPVISRYKHTDLFHLDELTMYSDISPTGISSTVRKGKSETILKKATVLMCCNASGTEKLPLLICGSYPSAITDKDYVYSHSENVSINDDLFREWLKRLNDHMSSNGRKILLLLHKNHASTLRGLDLNNVRHVFFPDGFPPLMRPLKRDVFHFVKMVYRSKYVEGIRQHGHRWNVENVVQSLVEAWRKVPRDLIIASFQRTSFRIDNCFLDIHCDTWADLKTGVSFRKFVTFDDDLSANVSHKQSKSTSRGHSYNLRTREIMRLIDDDQLDSANELKEKSPINNRSEVNGSMNRTDVKKYVAWKRKRSLKKSPEKDQVDKDCYEQANNTSSSDESTSRNNEDVTVPAKLPKVIDIQMMESATRSYKSAEIHSALAISRTNTNCDRELDKMGNNEERGKSVSGGERSIESSSEIDVASQQVLNDMSAADSCIKQSSEEKISCAECETESTDLNAERGHSSQKSLKRKHSDNVEDIQNISNDGEPQRKRSKSDSNWTKQYETTFVFGSSDLARTVPTTSADVLNDVGQPKLRQSCETERSIFIIRPRKD